MRVLLLAPFLCAVALAASRATFDRLHVAWGTVPTPVVTTELAADTIPTTNGVYTMEFITIDVGESNTNDTYFAEVTGGIGRVDYPFRLMKNTFSRNEIESIKAAFPGELDFLTTRNSPKWPDRGGDAPWMHANAVVRMHFVNWLNQKHGYPPAYRFDGEGNWILWDEGDGFLDPHRGENRIRHKDAFYFAPSLDEWHKAMYWDFTNKKWWQYPYGSDSIPATCAACTDAGTVVLRDTTAETEEQAYGYSGTTFAWVLTTGRGPAPIDAAGGPTLNGFLTMGNTWDCLETTYNINDPSAPLNASTSNEGDYWVAVRGSKWFYGVNGCKANGCDQERPYGGGGVPTLPYGGALNDSSSISIASKVPTVDRFGSGANAFQIDFVYIGDPTNAPTVDYMGMTVGRVDYPYRISKYEISEDQVRKATLAGQLPISVSNLGTNKPVTLITQWEAAHFVNWLNTSEGYPPAYDWDEDGYPRVWTGTNVWTLGGTNVFRHSGAKYFWPSWDEANKAARYNPKTATWTDYANGSNTPPVIKEGFFTGGTTEAGSAIFTQPLFPWYPEHDSAANETTVTLTTTAGAVSGIEHSAYVSGLVFQTNAGPFMIRQGAATNATATILTWQTIPYVPATFTNYVAGAGYTDGPATVTLGGNTVTVTLYTLNGSVMGAIPTGGAFASHDYTTDLPIVQAGGSNATCRVKRYSDVTYGGPKVAATWSIAAVGSGYTNGPAIFISQPTSWYPELDPATGVSFYTFCQGAADVDKAGGPSPYGVYGLGGNVTDMCETQHNPVDVGGGVMKYVNVDPRQNIKYFGGWWFRNYQVLRHGGNDMWTAWEPSDTRGAYGNGLRVAARADL